MLCLYDSEISLAQISCNAQNNVQNKKTTWQILINHIYSGIYYEIRIMSDSSHLGYMALCVLMEAENILSTAVHEIMFYTHLKEAMQCHWISLFNSLMKAQSQHEIRTDSMFFLNACSWSHCEWFIGAC